jgi:hypothetical protein
MVGGMAGNQERKARNETFFREINEGIEEVVEHSTTVRSGVVAFVCECAGSDCTQAIALTIDEYRRVRTVPTRFVVAPGHEDLEVERVVVSAPGFSIVEKLGEAAAVAVDESV